jgi:hypothetical protein
MSGPLTRATAAKVRQLVAAWPDQPGHAELEALMRWLAKWRSQALAQTFVGRHGAQIRSGLFAGMSYLPDASEGSLMARLLGTYEAELRPHIEALVAEGLDCVIDIGCAEGYYAVGLAYRFPNLEVFAFDIDETARTACAALAARNGVSERVHVAGEFRPADFQGFADRRVLVMVDAEGAELDVLQPELGPALAGMNLIVETHDVWRPGALQEIRRRFGATHAITEVHANGKSADLPDWLQGLSELDMLLATWEWRHRPTPWLVMRPLEPTARAGV